MSNKCPWCESENNSLYIKLKDYFLSREDFEIYECYDCKLLFTVPVPSEIGPYYKSKDYLSHNENRKGFIPKIYNKIKKINIKNKFKIVKNEISTYNGNDNNISSISLLDIGCGIGDFLHYAQEKGYNISGIEPTDDTRKSAEAKLGKKIMTPDKLQDISDNSYEVITMWHVLEHVADLKTEIHHLQRLLKKNGILVLALPNFKSFDAQFYKDKWAAYDVPRHLNHFSSVSIKNIFNVTSLHLIDIKPLKWDSFYISILSEKYCNHKDSFIKGIINGYKSNRKAKKSGEYSSLVYILKKI